MNYVFRSLGVHRKNYLTASLIDSTKTDIAVILVFFTELFDGDLIRGSLRELFTFSTGDSHEDTENYSFRESRLRLTSNNSVKNTIITAVSCLVESLTAF